MLHALIVQKPMFYQSLKHRKSVVFNIIIVFCHITSQSISIIKANKEA